MRFYVGAVLRIDLSKATSTVEPLNTDWAERYIGGKGLLLRYLWEEVPPGVDPWAPENPIVLMSGPFAGTITSSAERLVVGAKSVATGILSDSYVGGSFAPEMKYAGYDGIIIKGRAPEPVILTIRDDVVEFLPALPKHWGMKTSEIEAALREDFDPDAKVLSIGPAGENLVPFACVSTDQYHKAGRGGHGALMGSKNLKCIAVRGTGGVSVGDARAFLAAEREILISKVLSEDNLWATEEGTPMLVDPMNGGGVLPTRSFSSGTFEGAGKINSESLLATKTKNRACYQCALGCRQWHEASGVACEGPEYETLALCGANCGIDDLGALLRFNQECDEWGLDTISAGSVVGLAMDLTDRGIADFGVTFGDVRYVELPALIAKGEGVGIRLARGARGLAMLHDHPELAMEVKNLEIPGYDPRGAFGMSLAYATSDRGGCHLRGWTAGSEILDGEAPADSLEGKPSLVIELQHEMCLLDAGIWCDFLGIDGEGMARLMTFVWERQVAEDELEVVAERIWNLSRLFNLREGVEKDDLPRRLYAEGNAFQEGPSAGKEIGERAFRSALDAYYGLRGWDENGVPSEAKLAELGVDVRL